jgi:hypothetical protein
MKKKKRRDEPAEAETQPRFSWRRWRETLALMFVLAFGIGLTVASGRRMVREQQFQTHRAETTGTIRSVKVVRVPHGRTTSYRPEVVVDFAVDGVRHESRSVDLFGTAGSRETADEVAAAYVGGRKTVVHYHRDHPNEACLDPRTTLEVYFPLLCATFLWFCACIVVASSFGDRRVFYLGGAVSLVGTAVSVAHFTAMSSGGPRPSEWAFLAVHATIGVSLFLIPRTFRGKTAE